MKTFLTLIVTFLFLNQFLLAQNRDSSKAVLQRAILAKNERRIQLALNLFEQSIKYDSTNVDALKAMGEYGIESRNYRHAVDAYSRWYKLEPNNSAIFQQLATLYFNLGRYRDALQFIDKWTKLNNNQPMFYIEGMCHYYLENYPFAINCLLHAIEKDTTNAVIYYTIGRSYVELERFKQALPYYQKAIDTDPKNPRYVYEMGMVYYSLPDDKNAIALFELAAERGWQKNADFYENIAYSYMNTGNFAKASENLKNSLEIRPHSLSVRFALAEAFYKGGKYQDAIDNWDLVLQGDNKNAKSLYMIGMAYQKMGQKDKGVALCDKAIELDPSLNNLKQKKMDMGM